jgi:magnesium transporter
MVDPTEKDIDYIKSLNFHPVIVQELRVPTLRPKVEQYDNFLYMVLHFPIYHSKEKTSKSMEIDFLITKYTLITVRYGKIQPLHEFWKRCESKEEESNFQHSAASILYHMLQELNRFSFRQIDHITEKIDQLEKEIFEKESPRTEEKIVEKISIIRRDILDFRRILKPQYTILNSLKMRGMDFFGKLTEPYFVDIIGDHMRVWELLDNHKEAIESLQEANDSLLSNKTNRIVKLLTIFTVIVFPIIALSNIFSMSAPFYEPFAGGSILIMIAMAIGCLTIIIALKKKKWL